MTEVRFHRSAAKEYRAAIEWYRKRSARAAERFRIAVDHAVNQIAAYPLIHAATSKTLKYRRVRLKRFPYVLVFHLDDEGIIVVSVAHVRRKSRYWRGRRLN